MKVGLRGQQQQQMAEFEGGWRIRRRPRNGCCLLFLLASLLLQLLLVKPTHGVIRNNRVILHDEHLPNGGEDTEEPAEEQEAEHRRQHSNEQSGTDEEHQSRRKRALPEWRGQEWRRKASQWGQTEDELARIRQLMQRLTEEVAGKSPQMPMSEAGHQAAHMPAPAENLTEEQLREWRAWTQRRVNDDASGKVKKQIEADEANPDWPEESGRHFEGDIVLGADQAEQLLESARRAKRGGVPRAKRKFIGSRIRRWDAKKPILYSFDGSHTLREQRVIELALEHWHNITCLNFERRNDEPRGSRIVFTDVDGCASNVGRHPLGEPQFVSLAPECIRLGVIAHEVAHALGFWHEQSRPDRDLWVQVQWQNIDRDSKGQFLKEQPADVDNAGVPYDYGSIMHYRSKAFAKFDDLFTIGTFISDYQRTIGQRDQLSFNDIRLMNEIYCRETCPRQLGCQRGGYTDPRHCDRCRCPDGFTGTLCEQVMPGYGANCGGQLELGAEWTRIASPNYPAEFREGQECSWLLVAPPGQRVQLQFYGEFEMYCKVRKAALGKAA